MEENNVKTMIEVNDVNSIDPAVIVRTIVTVLVAINLILQAFGKSPISYDEGSITTVVTAVIEIIVIARVFWKNNSFTKNARIADSILAYLKKDNKES